MSISSERHDDGWPASDRCVRCRPSVWITAFQGDAWLLGTWRQLAVRLDFASAQASEIDFVQGAGVRRPMPWAVGIARHVKVSPVEVKLIWRVAGRGRPPQAVHSGHPVECSRRHARRYQAVKCELAKTGLKVDRKRADWRDLFMLFVLVLLHVKFFKSPQSKEGRLECFTRPSKSAS